MAYSRDKASSIRTKATLVSVPGYGDFYLRILTLAETKAWQITNGQPDQLMSAAQRLLCYTLSDESGQRLYKDDEHEQVALDFEWPCVEVLFDKALEMNKLSKKDEKKALADTAAAVKN